MAEDTTTGDNPLTKPPFRGQMLKQQQLDRLSSFPLRSHGPLPTPSIDSSGGRRELLVFSFFKKMADQGNTTEPILYCYTLDMISSGGVWNDKPLHNFAIPVMLWQMVLAVIVSRGLAFLLKPLRQPRVVAEILSGIVLGPSVLGKIVIHEAGIPISLAEVLFPVASHRLLETMGLIGLLYYLFMVGMEFDLQIFERLREKVIAIAAANMALPFIVTLLAAKVMHLQPPGHVYYLTQVVFIGSATTVTSFTVLVRVLAELKILNSELGQLVLPSAVLSDLMAWILLAATVVLPASAGTNRDIAPTKFAFLWISVSGIAFTAACWLVIRPTMCWILRRTPEGEPVDDVYISIIATGVLAAGIITDMIGFHAVYGAFVYGLVVPRGPLTIGLRNRLEEFVIGLLMPIFLATCGLKADLSLLKTEDEKGAAVVSTLSTIPCLLESLSLGLLMNTKGPIDMIILNIGKHKKIFDVRTYSLLILGSIVTMAAVTPSVAILNKTSRIRVAHKRRNLQRCRPDMELRMVACVYNARNVPSVISLLQMSNPTKRSPIFVYALHLLEPTGRASAMLIVHEIGKSQGQRQVVSNPSGGAMQSEQIIATFESYEQHAGGVSVSRSPPSPLLHHARGHLQHRRGASLHPHHPPFHKQLSMAGDFEDINPSIRSVNRSVLANAPCSVGILVDRGLSGGGRFSVSQFVEQHVAVLFFGGPDDREALAYSWRMAEHPSVNLTVVRFLPGEEAPVPPSPALSCVWRARFHDGGGGRQRQLDDECVNEFRLRYVSDESVMYTEKVVNNASEAVAAIRAMNSIHSMYVVGRGQGRESSPLLAGLTEWSEYPELGAIGDMLVSADFGAHVSVLVMQQHLGDDAGGVMEVMVAPDSPKLQAPRYFDNANHRSRPGGFSDGWSAI
ncbi:hypothetical protein MUK42_32663 [Musa troglodytarum]|uniref:Cation/H+ exchanger domain-containing protein n=1 Tax=Musa troglodytarum TaxID=320322 RepID=A0A9E7HT30_9LILI|nr:hypothetical protein MUK42_32663 [Musa troglodytarum]